MSLRAVTVGPQTTAGPSGESAAAAGFIAAGGSQIARKNRNSIVGAYIREFTDLTGWASAPVAQRLSASLGIRGLIAYLLLATARPAEAHYVRSCRSAWGHHATLVYPNFADTFERTAATLGFTTAETRQPDAVDRILATADANMYATKQVRKREARR